MSPVFPFESLSDERRALGLAIAVAVGIAFGFVLERAGFGRAQKLVGQFYGTDMTVLKVMFTGIVTAMIGAVALSAVGLLDLETVQFNYPTYLWPMIVGGLALGVGFVVSGYCPGTSLVAAASGKLDGLATVLGVMAGGLLYAELEPALGAFPSSGKLGTFTLSRWLGLPAYAVAGAVLVIAIGAFAGAEKIERLVRGDTKMKRTLAGIGIAVAFTLATGTVARAETKLLATVARIDIASDGSSAVAVMKDAKTSQQVEVLVKDSVTLDKFKDKRIGVGDEIKLKYEPTDGKNVSTYFKKAGGC